MIAQDMVIFLHLLGRIYKNMQEKHARAEEMLLLFHIIIHCLSYIA